MEETIDVQEKIKQIEKRIKERSQAPIDAFAANPGKLAEQLRAVEFRLDNIELDIAKLKTERGNNGTADTDAAI